MAEWFTATWGEAAPSTWNVALGVIRSAGDYWLEQGWTDAQPGRPAAPAPHPARP